MNLKSEKAATAVDIAIAMVILVIFIGLIANFIYGINKSSNDIDRKTEATNYAISEIEKLKAENFDTLETKKTGEYINNTPYYKTIKIEDYADLEENKGKDIIRGIIKKVTVEIAYKSGKEDKKVELTTVLTREN